MSHQSPGVRSCCLSALLFLLGLVIVSQPPYVNKPPQKLRGAQAQPRIAAAYGKLPLQFELNRGQTDPRVQFLSRGSGYTLFLAAGQRLLLGFIDPVGAAGELPAAFYGVRANDRKTGAAVHLATGPPTSHQDR